MLQCIAREDVPCFYDQIERDAWSSRCGSGLVCGCDMNGVEGGEADLTDTS